jgi:hypothetical protein
MANLTHLFKVGQKVRYLSDDDFGGRATWHKGTVTQTYEDHIIVDIPDISDHMWFEEGLGLDKLYPEYNFNI